MTELFYFETIDEAKKSAEKLKLLGGRAINFLSECVEDQELTRKKCSKTIDELVAAGFIFVRKRNLEEDFIIRPSLTGEESLLFLEENHDIK